MRLWRAGDKFIGMIVHEGLSVFEHVCMSA